MLRADIYFVHVKTSHCTNTKITSLSDNINQDKRLVFRAGFYLTLKNYLKNLQHSYRCLYTHVHPHDDLYFVA